MMRTNTLNLEGISNLVEQSDEDETMSMLDLLDPVFED